MRTSRPHLLTASLLALIIAAPARADAPADTAQHLPAFEEMLASVYRDNPQLKAERETLRALDEHVSQASASFRPSAAINTEYGEAGVSDAGAAWQYGQDRNLGLTVTQPLYNAASFGQWHAAKDRVFAGRAELTATEEKVFMNAITAWMDVYEKTGLLALNRDNTALSQSYFSATKQRFDAGDATQTDLAVAESRAAGGEARIAMAQAAYDSSLAVYERMTGMHEGPTVLPPLPAGLPRSEAETLEQAKLNPQLQQADYQTAAAEHDIDTAFGARLPTIFLRGTVYDQTAPDIGLRTVRGSSITINASFPIYAGGGEYSKEREAEILRDKSRFDSMTVTRNVVDEARQAWTRYSTAQSIANASDHAVDACASAQSGIEQEQKIGTRTLTEVLDAQQQSLNARITALQAHKELILNAYRLLAAVGRLTAENLDLPTRIYNPVEHYDDVADRWFGTAVDPLEDALH